MGDNLPSIPDLAQLQFLPPGLNAIAGQQIQTAQDQQQNSLAQGVQELRSKQLANMFQEANDPTRLAKGKADLEGVQSENIVKKIEAQQREQLAPEELEAKRAKIVKEWSNDKLAKAMNDAQQMMWSDDPAIKAKGNSLFANSQAELSQRAKAKDDMAKVESQNASHERVAGIGAAATRYSADKSAESRLGAAKARSGVIADFDTAVAAGKITPVKAATYYTAKANQSLDPEEQAAYLAKAAQMEKLAQSTAAASAAMAGRPDTSALGIPNQTPPSAFAPAPAAPAASKPALPPGWTMK